MKRLLVPRYPIFSMELDSSQPAKRKLPIGLQTFRTIREEHYYYVDFS